MRMPATRWWGIAPNVVYVLAGVSEVRGVSTNEV